MSSSDTRRVARFVGALALAGLTAGCFQPLYGERPTPAGGVNVASQLSAVDVAPIDAPAAPGFRA
jgi:LPS-assembly lipoprotein